jgi:hypothetical protein
VQRGANIPQVNTLDGHNNVDQVFESYAALLAT